MEPVSRRDVLGAAVGGAAIGAGCVGGSEEYGAAWADVDSVELVAETNHWRGQAPAPIADALNPALRFVHAREYEITWINGDGHDHVLQFRNVDEAVVEASDELSSVGDETTMTVEALPGVTEYVCPHFAATMRGSVELFSE